MKTNRSKLLAELHKASANVVSQSKKFQSIADAADVDPGQIQTQLALIFFSYNALHVAQEKLMTHNFGELLEELVLLRRRVVQLERKIGRKASDPRILSKFSQI